MWPYPFSHLFHIKDDNEFQGGDGREEWGEEGSDPADGLPVHNAQDIVWDGEFLLAPALDQFWGGTVGDQEPGNKIDTFLPDSTRVPRLQNHTHQPRPFPRQVWVNECVHACARRCVNACKGQGLTSGVSLIFWDRISHWAGSLLMGLKCVVQGSTLQCWGYKHKLPFQALDLIWRSDFRSSCLYGLCCTDWVISLTQYFFTLKKC